MTMLTTIPLNVSMPTVDRMLQMLLIVAAVALIGIGATAMILAISDGQTDLFFARGCLTVLGIVLLTVASVVMQSFLTKIGQRSIERSADILNMPVLTVQRYEDEKAPKLLSLVREPKYIVTYGDQGQKQTSFVQGKELAEQLETSGKIRLFEESGVTYLLSDQNYERPEYDGSAPQDDTASNDDVFFLWAWLTLLAR